MISKLFKELRGYSTLFGKARVSCHARRHTMGTSRCGAVVSGQFRLGALI